MEEQTPTTEQLIEATNRLREKLSLVHARYRLGEASFDDVSRVAKAFCMAFEAYQKQKYGKARKINWQSVVRSL